MLKSGYKIKDIDSVIATVFLSLLVVLFIYLNYDSQLELEAIVTQRYQSSVTQISERTSLVFNRIVDDTKNLSTGEVVLSFFINRSLGMSMEYGLKGTIDNVEVSFEQVLNYSHIENLSLYEDIILYDENFHIVASTSTGRGHDSFSYKELCKINETRSFSRDGFIHVVAPVVLNNHIVGALMVVVKYESLMSLFNGVGSAKTIYGIWHNGFGYFVNRDIGTVAGYKVLLNENVVDCVGEDFSFYDKDNSVLFAAENQNNNIKIYVIEDRGYLYGKYSPLYWLAILLLFGVIIVFFSVRLFKWSVKNSMLEETLQEVNASKNVLNEKKNEIDFIIDGAELGMWSWHVPTGNIEVNDQWAVMLGYDKSSIAPVLSSWADMIHPDDRQYVQHSMDKFLKSKTGIYITNHRLKHRAGSWVWVRDIGKAFTRDEAGYPLLVKGMNINITELKEAVLDAVHSRKEVDAVVDNFLDSLVVVDLDTNIVRVNKATCDLLGYEESDLLGQPVELFINGPLDIHSFFTCSDKADAETVGEERRNVELSFICKDGSQRLVSANFAVLKNPAGEVIGVAAGAKDISALKYALQEKEKQKHFVESILNTIPGGLLLVDKDCNIIQINSIYKQLINYWAVEHGFDINWLNSEVEKKIKEIIYDLRVGSFHLRSPQGGFLVIEYYSSLPSEDLNLNRVVFIHDVTQRYQAESMRKLHSTVLEQTGEAVVITNISGVILFANRAAEAISGYVCSETFGKNISMFMTNNDKSAYPSLLDTISLGENWKGPLTQKKKNGSLFYTECTVSPVRDESDTIINYVFQWRDVSHERLLQRQLLQAQKLEAVGQLAAGIAHELNTPIQYIQNNVSFFKDSFMDIKFVLEDVKAIISKPEPLESGAELSTLVDHARACDLDFVLEEIPQSMDESLTGIGHIVKIVAAMKEFSHPGSGDNVPADLNRIIENAIIVTKNEWKYVATLITDLDQDLPQVQCEPGAWSQVFLNLIVNSAQAIQEKDQRSGILGQITIATHRVDGGIRIVVEDTGIGIPKKDLDHIYELFFTTKDVGKGTGQGLSIVYDVVVNKHHGKIDCDSAFGDGTRFKIFIPIAEDMNGKNDE